MSNANGIITAPVSIDDVKTVLGVASNDLATLCKSSNINIWARFKPVSYPSAVPLDNNQLNDCGYGIKNINTYSTIADMLNAVKNATTAASMLNYDNPRGGMQSPYRLSDFKNYWHGAGAPVGPVLINPIEESAAGYFTIRFHQGDWNDQHFEIRMSDLALKAGVNFSNMYLGVVFFNGGTNYEVTSDWKMTDDGDGMFKTIKTPDGTVSDLMKHAEIDVSDTQLIYDETWRVLAFASSVQISNLCQFPNSAIFVPLISSLTDAVTIKKALPAIVTFVSAVESLPTVNVNYTVNNNASHSITVSSIDIQVYNSNKQVLGSISLTPDDIITSHSSKSYLEEIRMRSAYLNDRPTKVKVTAIISGTTYISESGVIQEAPSN